MPVQTDFKITFFYNAYLSADDIRKGLEDFLTLYAKTEPNIYKYEVAD